jgi:hypothetical protein
MLTNAITLAVLSTAGMWVIYKKLPRKIRRWIKNHGLLADISALLLTYTIFGGTVTALIAAALAGLMTSVLIYIGQHKEDFLFIEDAMNMIKDKLEALKQLSQEWGQAYREKKLEEAESCQLQQ